MPTIEPITRMVQIDSPNRAAAAVGDAFDRVLRRLRDLRPRVTDGEIEAIRRALGEVETAVRAEGLAFILQAAAEIDQRGAAGFLLPSRGEADDEAE